MLEVDVDYLPLAKPDAIKQLGIRRDCAMGNTVAGCW
jgi:hypothetical protein